MDIKFTKMHGLGNDFMVIDGINQSINLQPETICALAKRNTGIGFDQCLLIETSQDNTIDFFYRIFNADGQEVGQCGNGARCLALFVQHYGLTKKPELTIATPTTRMHLVIHPNKTVTVEMEPPKLQPAMIPFNMPEQAITYALTLQNDTICQIHAIHVGNPHAIMIVSDITKADVHGLGKAISEHHLFPQQTNVGFMQICQPNHIHLRVYERGSGETQACGSGAVAAVAIGRLYHQLADSVTVNLPGGELIVSWPNISGPIFLTGPATFVYEGQLI